MTRLKSSNLIAGFRASGIYPLNRNEVLKRISSRNHIQEVNLKVLNDSVLQVLEENCGVGKQKISVRKRGKKITPGERIVDLENQEPCGSQGSKKRKTIAPSKRKASNNERCDDEEDEWRCFDCNEVWDERGNDRWVVCNICSLKFHLQCSGISYDVDQYWDIDLESTYFE